MINEVSVVFKFMKKSPCFIRWLKLSRLGVTASYDVESQVILLEIEEH